MDTRKQFDNILEECLDSLLTGKSTVEQCLRQHPEYAVELEPLLRTACSVNRAVNIEPDAQVKERGRLKLQLKMAEAGKSKHVSSWNWQPRWAMAVMAVLLVFVLGGGTVLAADGSMPGSPLYPIKIATENVRIMLKKHPAEKAELYAAYADRRVAELSYVAERGNSKPEQVEKIAARYTYCMTQIYVLPINGNGTAAGGAMTPSVIPGKQPGMGMMSTPQASREATAKPGETDAIISAEQSLPAVTTLTAGERARLLRYINYLAVTHPAELEKYIESFPEPSRLAIRRMIQDAKDKYPQLIDKLERSRGAGE